MKRRPSAETVLFHISSYLLVFAAVGFIITCSFLLLFHWVELPASEIRAFAPAVFINTLVLTALLMGIDRIRRKLTVDRSVKEIQQVLGHLMDGDFSARIAEEAIAGKYNKLEDIAAGVNRLAEELAGVETLRTDFITNVSHELKTPLAVMQNYGTMLQQPGLTEEQCLEYAKAITDTSRRLAGLITNILKLSKLENQQIFPLTEEYDLGEQLCECLLQFESQWENKSIELQTDIAEGVRICADGELLSLVWNNLFSNAFKFTPAGGRVTVSLSADDRYATVTVADTGCGMTPQVGAHIFEKFYQGDTSHAARGNGLGLALVRRVVDITHGEIGVESVCGEGSTFTVRIRRRL